jgi:hypothetical protein
VAPRRMIARRTGTPRRPARVRCTAATIADTSTNSAVSPRWRRWCPRPRPRRRAGGRRGGRPPGRVGRRSDRHGRECVDASAHVTRNARRVTAHPVRGR